MQTAEAKSIGIWIRVSTEDQARGESPKLHEERARQFAVAKGWNIKEVYDLAGVSGKAVMEHREAKRMMEDVRRGHIKTLVFSKLARLTRNARELMDFSDFFAKHGADLVSLQESFDTSTPGGRLFYNVVAVIAQWEREEITDRVRASVAIRAQMGKPLNGRAPYGYVWKNKELQPEPSEAPVRKLMYELFIEHRRKKTVARVLNEKGYRTRDGSNWSDTSVERLLKDPTAKGIHRANFTRRVADNKPWVLKPEHDWVLSAVEPIVSEDVWNRCNEILENRRATGQRPGKRTVHPFAGIAICECGKKLYVPTNSPKYVCMECRNKIPIVDLEAHFLDELQAYLLSPEAVAQYVREANSTVGEKEAQLESLSRELHKIRASVERLFELWNAAALSADQFKERHEPLDGRKKEIEAELPKLHAEIDLLKIDGLSEEVIMAEAVDLASRWPSMDIDERRKIVELLVKSIVVGKDDIEFNLCYVPRIKEMTEGQRTL